MSVIELIDTHCHLDDALLHHDLEVRLARARTDGVTTFLVPAVCRDQWSLQADVVARHPGVFGAYGMHPCYIERHETSHVDTLERALHDYHAIAVGEIGLDFFITPHDEQAQIQLLDAQLAVAKNLDLPVILHARKSHDLLLKSLRRAQVRGGIVHAFSGSLQQAQYFVDLGFLIGFGGGVTYDRANKLHTILSALSLDAIALETDAPDIPPCFARDVPNTPEHLRRIAEIVATRKGVPLAELAATTTRRVREVFRLPV